MRALPRLIQVKAGAACDDVLLEFYVLLQHLLDIEDLRLAVDDGEHDDAVADLKLRVAV